MRNRHIIDITNSARQRREGEKGKEMKRNEQRGRKKERERERQKGGER